MNFRAGDHFRVKSNGITGQIIAIQWNRVTNEDEYVVVWDTLSRKANYTIQEGDNDWEPTLVAGNNGLSSIMNTTIRVPAALDSIPISIEVNDSLSCFLGHEWVKYQGLNEAFEYCRNCDKKNV